MGAVGAVGAGLLGAFGSRRTCSKAEGGSVGGLTFGALALERSGGGSTGAVAGGIEGAPHWIHLKIKYQYSHSSASPPFHCQLVKLLVYQCMATRCSKCCANSNRFGFGCLSDAMLHIKI